LRVREWGKKRADFSCHDRCREEKAGKLSFERLYRLGKEKVLLGVLYLEGERKVEESLVEWMCKRRTASSVQEPRYYLRRVLILFNGTIQQKKWGGGWAAIGGEKSDFDPRLFGLKKRQETPAL